MTLEKAREWASRHDHIRDVFHPDAKAAVEVIQSLPDQWVDTEKVREIIESKEGRPPATALPELLHDLRNLLTPKLRTLADMTAEEREACKWMQCKVETDGEDTIGVIWMIWSNRVHIIFQSGIIFDAEYRRVTPLTGEPKLEWPGSGDTPTIAQKEKVADDQAVAKDVCNSESNSSETPKSSIKPEDVPDNELWLVALRGEEWAGRRSRKSRDYPWHIASPNGEGAEIAQDSEITLIHKLVAEPPALPEGMRLADHETLGRIIVSHKEDSDGEHLAFFSDKSTRLGADWMYLQKREFTYLDGETK